MPRTVGKQTSLFRVGNAPCSWGTLEFEETRGEQIEFAQMLDELVDTGYTGTELGDWNYMPTDPGRLKSELESRGLVMLGAFVQVALKNPAAHKKGLADALKTARLIASVATDPQPYLVLADDNATVPLRTQNAGRVTPEIGLNTAEWRIFADGANEIGRQVLAETGLRTVFHHHCAGYVETPDEVSEFLNQTDPNAIGLVFDTGHFAFGSGNYNVVEAMERFKGRIKYVHLKDCHPGVARKSREENWNYFEALRQGVFCELGKGGVDFPAVLRWLKRSNYSGYVLVEQDVLPGMGSPRESARRNREYLRSIENNYA